MKSVLLIIILLVSGIVLAQNKAVGIFDGSMDVGKPKKAGSSAYDPATQTYTLSGGGYNIWFGRDEFHYLHKKIKGDFILTADFEFIGKGTNAHRKIGWMLRQTADEDSPHISATLHGDGLTVLQWRPLKGSHMRDPEDQLFSPKKNYQVLRLERNGKKVTMQAAHWGEPMQTIGSYEMQTLPDEIFAGLFISSHDPDVVEQAKVWNVRIEKTVPDKYNAYQQGFIGSRLETLSVFDGKRRIIHEAQGCFEAPNWMPDGKKLLFNEKGSLYLIPVEGGTPEKLNTGAVNRNNNDHVISFDGKLLAVSSHKAGPDGTGGGSAIYVLPLTGGEPKLVTQNTPSYLHGWNTNNKEVLYVAKREGSDSYDLYKTNINGGPEIKLTDNKNSHADGPEFSPDGKYIYYNANASGTMQVWRMKPDGSGKEQVTFDEFNNWFPHISPDGKWMVIISFPETVDSGDHPFYKRVMLRMMPTSGGVAPKVIAYLYGGQGTINVPSWSPDSKSIAFVSNSGPLNP